MPERLTVKEAAELMGVSEMFLRIGLRNNQFPFGYAVKTSKKYTYWISPKLFEEHTGIKL